MNQNAFETGHGTSWKAFDARLKALRRKGDEREEAASDWPRQYRQVTHDLALAQSRAYSPELVDRLNLLALRGHQRFYGSRGNLLAAMVEFIGGGFPALVRRESLVIWIACALLFIPMLGMIALLQHFPEFVHYLLSPDQLREYEGMYSPANRALGPRHSADSQTMMFGYYIWNNVRIDFQCFATGLFFGLGSVFFLLFNGVQIGSVAGYLTQQGYIQTFWGFVAGHSAWELLGAAISGAAGLKIGWALIAPGQLTRIAALKDASTVAVRLLYGAAGMTTCAAFVEAFWSSISTTPFALKIGVGLTFWALFICYFMFAGRGRNAN
ncbi:MAG TPA: stage II sporulation protein M [Burkholderiales bacterium]|nr:stage II sporulation protein M [Burkholderiales bacterium]